MSDTVKLNPCPRCGAAIPAEAPQGLCPKCVLVGAATATEAGLPATATAEIPSLERVAAAFPQLEILELLGRGGMGFVFKARQPHLDRFVALKLLPDKLARDPRFAERFNREGRVLAKLSHPNIVSVYDFGQTEHFYFLLMELVDGVNLRQAMKAGRFSPGEALAIVPKICEALQYAHGQGILHRDIKPENILLDAHGHVKIADFGIAKLVGEEKPDVALTATGASLGTLHYMAPEQLEHPLTVDHRADIYSLGVVFYEMLTGELPIGRFAAPSSKTPVGTAVDEVVFRTLEKDRERRYQSAGEVKTQVEHLAESDTAGGPPVRSQAAPLHSTHRHWARITGWVVAALLLVNFLGLHVTRIGNSPADTITIGLTTPWLVNLPLVDAQGGIKREFRFNFNSSAFSSGIIAVLLCIVLLATRRFAGRIVQGPAGAALPAVPAWSHKAIWGAVLTGLSLPLPMLIAVLVYFTGAGLSGAELLLGAAAIGLPGLVGTLLGWMALSDLRAHQGRLRGLPLAVFAALAYPLLMLVAATLVIPWVLTKRSGGPGTGMPLLGLIVLLIPLGTITFGIWAVFAAARWGANKSPTRRRGVLKWVFLTMLFVVVGVVAGLNFLQGRAPEQTREEPSPSFGRISAEQAEATPWIRFTFTAVELHEVEGGRWLAIDYVDDVHGDCQKAFPWKTTIPGFKAESRTAQFVTEHKDSPAVRHQRIQYLMPDSAPREQLDSLREDVEKALKQKSLRLELGEQQAPVLLFELPGVEGGSLKAWVKVVPPLKTPTDSSPAGFGPAMELVLPALTSIELSSGRTKALPATIANQDNSVEEDAGISGWLRRERLHLAFSGRGFLHGNAQGFATLGREEWDSVSPAQLARSLVLTSKDVPFKLEPRTARHFTYGFKTGDGRLALLQVIDRTDGSGSVMIRYKLARDATTPSASQPNASAELWSPTLAPDEELKVSDVLREAERLAREGRFEEALQRHIWYHNHALEFDPAQTGVRLSFALLSWLKLAGRYPKAHEALVEIRDRGAQEFVSGLGDETLFKEVSSINQHLGQNDSTLALFNTVHSQDPRLAKRCYWFAEDLLVEKGLYALCVSYIPNVPARFESIRKARERLQEIAGRTPDGTTLSNAANRAFIKDTRKLVEILVAVGRRTEGEQIRDQALPVLDVPELRSAVGDAEQKVKSAAPLKLPATQQTRSLGTARLVAAQGYQHVAIARIESLPGHPLHQIVARFAGPMLPERSSPVTGPLLVPSPGEGINTSAEPVDGSITWSWGTSMTQVVASAVSFECPGDYSFQFVLPDEALARDAARQMTEALAKPVSLVPGSRIPLFTVGQWKGWLETRPFVPEPYKFTFFRHPGRAPAQIPGTNYIDSAVATIPPGHELRVTGLLTDNGRQRVEPRLSTMLRSSPNEAGVYWFTWYALPNPQRVDDRPKQNWEFQIRDTAGNELLRCQAPTEMKIDWQRAPIGKPISVGEHSTRDLSLFMQPFQATNLSYSGVSLRMEMKRSHAENR